MSFGPPLSMYTQSVLSAEEAKKKRRRRIFTGILAAFLALSVALGSWLLWPMGGKGDDKKEDAQQAADEVRERAEKPPAALEGVSARQLTEKVADDDTLYTPGTWVTEKLVVKGTANHVYAYPLEGEDGKPRWDLDLGGHLCAVTDDVTADGRTAVIFQLKERKGAPEAAVCDQVAFIDLKSGKKLWQKRMPSAGFAEASNTNVAMAKGTVAVAWGRGSVAYDMKGGKQLWNGTTTSDCEDSGFAGGRALLTLMRCGELPDATFRVQKLDPRTGRALWTYKVGEGIRDVYLPSSDPPVLAVAAGDISVTDLISLDSQGKHQATMSLSKYETFCGGRNGTDTLFGEVDECGGLVVGHDQAFVMSEEQFGSGQPKNWIVGFDLKTGRTTSKLEGRTDQPVFPVQMSGDNLLIFRKGFAANPAVLLSWNPRTEKQTPYYYFVPAIDLAWNDLEEVRIFVDYGYLIFAWHDAQRDEEYPDDPVGVLAAYRSLGRQEQ